MCSWVDSCGRSGPFGDLPRSIYLEKRPWLTEQSTVALLIYTWHLWFDGDQNVSCLSVCKACLHVSWKAERISVKQYWCILLKCAGTLQLLLEFSYNIWHSVFYMNFLSLNRYLFLEQKVLHDNKLCLMLGSLFLKHYIFRYNKRNSTDTPELLPYVYIFQFVYFFSRRIRSTFQPKLLIVLFCMVCM
jgi:hypothetical protein